MHHVCMDMDEYDAATCDLPAAAGIRDGAGAVVGRILACV